jgi:membrane protease YdiL (CAAX protease family)
MTTSQAEGPGGNEAGAIRSVLLFWVGYIVITLTAGFATSKAVSSEVWQLTAWGLVSSGGLIALTLFLLRRSRGRAQDVGLGLRSSSLKRFAIGTVIGVASFGLHLLIVTTFAGTVRFELVPETGALTACVFFARFVSTSCMEELGFRGYVLQRLARRYGAWPAVGITAVAFGLSHLMYGWDLTTIAIGVIPGGLLWGMSALATHGLAVPIALHAAWNFATWSVGARAETGVLRMITEEGTAEHARLVGTASWLAIFGGLTVVFWLVHRRRTRLASQGSS